MRSLQPPADHDVAVVRRGQEAVVARVEIEKRRVSGRKARSGAKFLFFIESLPCKAARLVRLPV